MLAHVYGNVNDYLQDVWGSLLRNFDVYPNIVQSGSDGPNSYSWQDYLND